MNTDHKPDCNLMFHATMNTDEDYCSCGADPGSKARMTATKLTPIPWGKPDRDLGFAVCSSIFDTTPPIIIQWNPLKDARVRRALHLLGVPT